MNGNPGAQGTLDRALSVVSYLRRHCEWDRTRTARSLVPHLLEEAHEVVEAIHADDPEALRGELGDLLLNVAFQVIVAEEAGAFTREDVVRDLEAKMIRRHPHLFGKGEAEAWDAIKARERLGSGSGAPGQHPAASEASALDGLPRGLDPLLKAERMQVRAAGVGFDWDEAAGALAKVREELSEVEEAASRGDARKLEEEVGDLLFAAVNFARLSSVNVLSAMERANTKFFNRFRSLEVLARERGLPLPGSSLEALDELWDEVKREERESS